VERALWNGLSLRVEGGPMTELFPHAQTEGGAVVGSETSTPLTGWVAGGLVWRI
jgi:hypothetical protein